MNKKPTSGHVIDVCMDPALYVSTSIRNRTGCFSHSVSTGLQHTPESFWRLAAAPPQQEGNAARPPMELHLHLPIASGQREPLVGLPQAALPDVRWGQHVRSVQSLTAEMGHVLEVLWTGRFIKILNQYDTIYSNTYYSSFTWSPHVVLDGERLLSGKLGLYVFLFENSNPLYISFHSFWYPICHKIMDNH